jgi:hypothetical protein
MGKSYRKPYSAVTGVRSAHHDKTVAARGLRRGQNHALRTFKFEDWDEFIMPHRLECSWNNTYSWSRDGKQTLQFPYTPPLEGIWNGYSFNKPDDEFYQRIDRYYERLQRK